MKNKQTKILKESKGITLIALVITIIVLLILAAVSIATLTGENGVLTKATKAEEETEKAEAEEQVNLAVLASYDNSGNLNYKELENNLRKISNITGVPSPITELPIGVDVNGYSIIINNNGTLEMSKIQIGDYVAYDPTKSDAEGTTAVDSKLLTYQSPVGGYSEETGRIEHGNGSSVQTFTAKPNDGTENGLKWRVLEVQGDKITLISNTKVKTDNNENFILKGGIGYLYAEQEA